MSKGRIAEVMGQRCCGHHGPEVKNRKIPGQLRVSLQERLRHTFPQRAAYAGHFKAMGKPGVYKVIFRKRMDLCLVLKTPERV
jgi:hypothetical protein